MKQNSSVTLMLAAVATLVISATSSAQAQTFWQSTSSTDPTVAGNWSGPVPTIGGVNTNGILDNGSAPINYTSAYGSTTFGTSAGTYGGLFWLGTFATQNAFNLSGGTVTLNGAFGNDGGTETAWFGNGSGSIGTFTVTGGSASSLNGTLLGRDGGTGDLSVSNGSYTTGVFSSSYGMFVGGAAGILTGASNNGAGLVTIGNGGLVDVSGAAANPLLFSGLTADLSNTGTSYIDFTSGSTGELELNLSGATLGTSYFTDLVEDGYVKVGATVDMNISDFAVNYTNTSAATLSLESSVAVPEPSTWAMMLGGLLLFGFVARRRTARL